MIASGSIRVQQADSTGEDLDELDSSANRSDSCRECSDDIRFKGPAQVVRFSVNVDPWSGSANPRVHHVSRWVSDGCPRPMGVPTPRPRICNYLRCRPGPSSGNGFRHSHCSHTQAYERRSLLVVNFTLRTGP